MASRYGGEEFAVILPETSRTGAYVVADRVRQSVENHFRRTRGVSNVTVSGGVATFPDDATTFAGPGSRRPTLASTAPRPRARTGSPSPRGSVGSTGGCPPARGCGWAPRAAGRPRPKARNVSAGGVLVSLQGTGGGGKQGERGAEGPRRPRPWTSRARSCGSPPARRAGPMTWAFASSPRAGPDRFGDGSGRARGSSQAHPLPASPRAADPARERGVGDGKILRLHVFTRPSSRPDLGGPPRFGVRGGGGGPSAPSTPPPDPPTRSRSSSTTTRTATASSTRTSRCGCPGPRWSRDRRPR